MVLNKDEVIESKRLLAQLEHGSAKYLYVNVVSKRCKQLASGSPKMVHMEDPCHSLGDVVAKEIKTDTLTVRPLPGNHLIDLLDK
jgi:DNA-directed RNA polymerase subunit K/omega